MAVERGVEVKPYSTGDQNQLWRCIETNNHLGLMNLATGRFMGNGNDLELRVDVPHLRGWEYVTMRVHNAFFQGELGCTLQSMAGQYY